MFSRLLANKGLNAFMGLKRFGAAARGIGRGAASTFRGARNAGAMYQAGMRGPAIGMGMAGGMRQMGAGFRSMGRWATGAGAGVTGMRRAGVAAGRIGALGAGAIGAGAAADFMNPWGLGWGD